ncbi:MAG: MFS transporter, partial [Pseudomonadota bacterium]
MTRRPAARRPASPPHLVTLVLLAAFSPLSLNLFLPSLGGMAADLGTDYATMSLAISGYLAVTAAIQLVVGPLSDRVGRRPVLLGALAVFAGASVGCALAEEVWTFLAFRMLQGGMTAGYALSMAIVRDTRSEREAVGLIGWIGMAMAVGPMAGPVIGGALDAAFGWRAAFVAYAVSGLALLLLCWVDLGETRRSAGGARPSPLAAAELLGVPRFWAFSLCGAFSVGGFYVFLAGAPLVATRAFGIAPAELGVFIGSITAGFMAGGFVAGRLGPRLGPAPTAVAGRLIACLGTGAGLLAFHLGAEGPWVFFASTLCVGLGNGVSLPGASTGAMSVRPDLAGSAAGLNGAMAVAGG